MDLVEMKLFNPWWENSDFRFAQEGIIPRKIDKTIEEYMRLPHIVAIMGIRRIGKTTLMEQLINHLLKKKVTPKHILFFSFEEHLGKTDPGIIEKILQIYIEQVLNVTIWDIKEVYIFLDEIQYIDNWQDVIKRYYDRNKHIKFIISGSHSATIRKRSQESLAGRIFELYMPVISFREFCLIKGTGWQIPSVSCNKIVSLTANQIKEINNFFNWQSNKISTLYPEYLYKGQFPETTLMSTKRLVNRYIKGSILKKILVEDAPKIFNIDKVGEFSSIYSVLSRETGNLFEILNLAREVGISKDTLHNYLYYYEQIFLADIILNHTKKLRRQFRLHKKFYIASPNFTCNELNLEPGEPLFFKVIGSLVETTVFQLLKEYFEPISFWKEREREIDFIITQGQRIIPIEVKYTHELLPKHYKTLIDFMEHNNLKIGIVITQNKAQRKVIKGKKLLFVPVWALE